MADRLSEILMITASDYVKDQALYGQLMTALHEWTISTY